MHSKDGVELRLVFGQLVWVRVTRSWFTHAPAHPPHPLEVFSLLEYYKDLSTFYALRTPECLKAHGVIPPVT